MLEEGRCVVFELNCDVEAGGVLLALNSKFQTGSNSAAAAATAGRCEV